jgi:glycosyltransferase involved in cell wall biosynthesis
MKILMCHNYYQQRGGEDMCFNAEANMLEGHGHQVIRYTIHNDNIEHMSKLGLAANTFWNPKSYRSINVLLKKYNPDVMHCTNTFPLLSPAALYAARQHGIPRVMSLRNFRLICPGTLLMKNGEICEQCVGRKWPIDGIKNRCYRQSLSASAVVGGMLGVSNMLNVWQQWVSMYFTPSEHTRQKHLQAGFDADQIMVKPDFLDRDPGAGSGDGDFAVYLGRLAQEKDLPTLLQAWQKLPESLHLKVIGDGPMLQTVKDAAAADPRIEVMGWMEPAEALRWVGRAKCLIVPSRWYETFGRIIIEAFACGTPVLASRLGALNELIEDGVTGFGFKAGDSDELLSGLRQILSDQEATKRMRVNVRERFLDGYTAERNYPILMDIYQRAIQRQQRYS